MSSREFVDDRVRRARWAGWGTAVAASLAGVLLVAVVDAGLAESTLKDGLKLLATSLWVGSPLIGYRAYAQRVPSGGAIVWFRRFRRTSSFNFAATLGRAATGIGHPLTLQDTTVPTSLAAAGVRTSALVLSALCLLLFGVGLLAVLLLLVTLHLAMDGVALLLVLVGYAVAFANWVRKALRRVGYGTLDADKAVAQVRARLEAVNRGRRRLGIGLDVIRCPRDKDEQLWQQVVRTALCYTSLAVVDVSEVNDNIRFELTEALSTLGPDRVLLVAEEGAAPDDQVWYQACLPALTEAGRPPDRAWLRSRLYRYPAHAQRYGPRARRLYDRQTRQLRAQLAARMGGTGPVRRPGSPTGRR